MMIDDCDITRRMVVVSAAAVLGVSAMCNAGNTATGLVRSDAKRHFQRTTSSGHIVNSRRQRLAYNLSRVSSGDIVILVHGFGSDKSSDGRFDYIARLLSNQGLSSLAFDFAGYGESDDDLVMFDKLVDDLTDVIKFVRSLGFVNIGLWGNSLGSRVSLTVPSEQIRTMVLSAACAGPIRYDWTSYLDRAQLDELERTSVVTMPVQSYNTSRKRVLISRSLIDAFSSMDVPKTLGRVKCPVLLINGTEGEEEKQLSANSKRALIYLPEGSKAVVVNGAYHDFNNHLDDVTRAGLNWLASKSLGVES